MNPHTENLMAAISQYETKCGLDPSESILDALWYDYSCTNSVDDGRIREAEEKIAPVFEELTVASSDLLSDLIVELVTGYQRAAYLEGLRTGVHLIMELT